MNKTKIAGKEVSIYAETVEPEAMKQFESAMECDFAIKGALMPDAHRGYSLPIGGVVATENVILPSWVGYDIGCGMAAVKISNDNLKDTVKEHAQAISRQIYRDLPVGFSHHNRQQEWPDYIDSSVFQMSDELRERFKGNNNTKYGLKQLSTLGGGNHFCELSYDENNNIWIVIHSGSRGIGWQTARRYMCLASNSDKPKEGHYALDAESDLGIDYIIDMMFCLEFALENRKQIIRTILDVLTGFANIEIENTMDTLINRNHNHAELKDGLWIHRKGATHAEKDMMGVIPGNMRDGSFIVKGKGNPDSLQSSSHGAGRVLSRTKAKALLNVNDFQKEMEGITARVGRSTLDESPMAYKNIFEVMELQKDLVDIVAYLKPMINIKG